MKVTHSKLHRGDLCPKCFKAKLYLFKKPARIVRMIAQPIFQATIFELERLRCALCGALFTAPPPPEAGHSKYDPSVGVMLALTRYGIGLPMYRTDKWQSHFGVPLPASTQWKLIDATSPTPQALYEGLIDVAAGGSIIHTDDTMMRVQSLRREILQKHDQRTGIFTTGIVSRVGEHQIALFSPARSTRERTSIACSRIGRRVWPSLCICVMGSHATSPRNLKRSSVIAYATVAAISWMSCITFPRSAGKSLKAWRRFTGLMPLPRSRNFPIRSDSSFTRVRANR